MTDFSAYTTGFLAEVVQDLKRPTTFFLDTFFRAVQNSTTAEIIFDVELKGRQIAPFVLPHQPGQLQQSNGYRTDRYTPATLKPKRVISLDRPLRRMIGEAPMGAPNMTPQARLDALIVQETQDAYDTVIRSLELMAVDAWDDGIVTVRDVAGNTLATVNFGRPNALTVALSGGARWGEAGVSPFANLETWRTTFLQENGFPADRVVLDQAAWAFLRADAAFREARDVTLRGSTAAANAMANGLEGGEMVAMLNETTQVWLYQGWFNDPANNNAVTSTIPANTVYLGSSLPASSQTRGFGVIQDAKLGYPSVEFAAKMIGVDDEVSIPAVLGLSSPLMILSRPGASFRARVR